MIRLFRITNARSRPIAWCYYCRESALRNEYGCDDATAIQLAGSIMTANKDLHCS
jgi:hypothetical protein